MNGVKAELAEENAKAAECEAEIASLTQQLAKVQNRVEEAQKVQ